MDYRELPFSKIESALLTEPHVVRVIKPNYPIPEVNLRLWTVIGNPGSREKVNTRLGNLANYLNTPYVQDDFSNHHERRDWRKYHMYKKYPWFHSLHEANPFRNNGIMLAQEAAAYLVTDYASRGKNELRTRVAEIRGHIAGATWEDKPMEFKRLFVGSLKYEIFDLLQFLGSCGNQLSQSMSVNVA